MEIDLIDLGDVKLHVYANDHIVKFLRVAPRNSDGDAVLNLIFDAVISQFRKIKYIEVGCNYGLELLRAARYLKTRQPDAHVLAFDPGESGNLVPKNIMENKMDGFIKYLPYAVSDQSGTVAFYAEPGHTEDNRMVNSKHTMREWHVTSVKLDEHTKGYDGAIIAKIDTQGGEPEVFDGATETLTKPFICISEFTPWAIATRRSPVEFLEKLSSTHDIVDLGADRTHAVPVNDYNAFAQQIDNIPAKWTDILLLPKHYQQLSKNMRDKLNAHFSSG